MTHTIRFPPLAGAMAIAFCLATLAITAPNQAAAQGIRASAAQAYYNGYGAGYNSGYQNGYGYTGYGNGPYGYGSAAPYGYPSNRYGYQSGTYNGLDYRALRLHGRTIYTTRFYDPYGGY